MGSNENSKLELLDGKNSEVSSDMDQLAALQEKFDSMSDDRKREFRCFSNFLSLLCGEYIFLEIFDCLRPRNVF